MSLRAMEKETGISRSRLDDLFHERMGSPSLQEFVTLCMLFHRRASACLKEAMKNAGQKHDEIIEAARVHEARDQRGEITDDLIDRIAAHPEDYDVAANTDPNNENEMNGGEGR